MHKPRWPRPNGIKDVNSRPELSSLEQVGGIGVIVTHMNASTPHVAVVGAGIIGATIAFTLARRGARVSLIDSGAFGGLATNCSFAWTNATQGNPKPYFDLRVRSMAAWDELAAELPDLPYVRTGSLYADDERFGIEQFVENHAGWGYDIRRLSPEQAQQYEPAAGRLEGPLAICDSEGAAEATPAAAFLADQARKAGAQLMTGMTVDGLSTREGRVDGVIVEGQHIDADEVVVAAGVDTARIVGPLGVALPMENSPGLLVNTRPLPKLMSRILLLTGLHVRQRPDGALVAGADFGGGDVNEQAESGARELIEAIRSRIQGAETAELSHFTVGYRPMPEDGFPVVGRPEQIGGLYIAVMHSGVTLAPIVGQFAADEILDGRRDRLLDPYGADRFSQG